MSQGVLSKDFLLSKKMGEIKPSGRAMGLAGPASCQSRPDEDSSADSCRGDADQEKRLLTESSPGGFILLLKHRPDVERGNVGLFDLQLSGHVHKGQIFPFRLITRLFYPLYSKLYSLGNNSSLYVNAGSGTWGPPIRFLAPPEVTLVELVHRE